MRWTKVAYLMLALAGGVAIWSTVGDDARFDPLFFLRDRKLDKTGRTPMQERPSHLAAPAEGGPGLSDGAAGRGLPPAGMESGTAPAGRLLLGLPLDCEPGQSCFVSKYPDMVAGDAYGDFQCGSLSSAGSRGTNFRILSYQDMEAGVSVLAAADGIVQFVRDGMPDVSVNLVGQDAVKRLGLGNAVLLRHSGGELLTGYAHMRRGSIRVKEGDLVRKGQVLGYVGLSGMTESPQLYFELIVNGRHLDPFTGFPVESGCARQDISPWWDRQTAAAIAYHPTLLVRAGFSTSELTRDAMEYMLYETDNVIARGATQVFLHVYLLGLKKNDRVRIRMTAPDGRTLSDRTALVSEDAGVRLFRSSASGGNAALPIGMYFGQFTLVRPGVDGKDINLFDIERTFEIR